VTGRQWALQRPIAVEGIVYEDGRPCIRDTGICAGDVSFALGAEGLTDEQLLERYAELEPSDLEAVHQHGSLPVEFDRLLDRVVGPCPSGDDLLDAYLFLPRIKLSYHEHTNMGVPVRVRSSFEAAFTDAANAHGSWIGAIGDLVFLDQVGTALTRTDVNAQDPSSIERALGRFSDLEAKERAAIYALRNALAHDFSLVNNPSGNRPRDADLRHAFNLELDGASPLIVLPDRPWDGNPSTVNVTHVNLARLAELTAGVRQRIFECYANGVLTLALSPEETRRRYIFTHGATIEEFNEQQNADQRVRWGY
jgi:uncharacterized protein (DUF433 family)